MKKTISFFLLIFIIILFLFNVEFSKKKEVNDDAPISFPKPTPSSMNIISKHSSLVVSYGLKDNGSDSHCEVVTRVYRPCLNKQINTSTSILVMLQSGGQKNPPAGFKEQADILTGGVSAIGPSNSSLFWSIKDVGGELWMQRDSQGDVGEFSGIHDFRALTKNETSTVENIASEK